jgi:glycosyltransferase involved in cell wall biosynthesis
MGPCFGTILRLARKGGKTKVLSILDNVIPHEKRPGDVPFTRYFLKPVDAFLAMSREVQKDLTIFSQKPCIYVPHPLYDNYGAPVTRREALGKLGLDEAQQYILFFGFIRKYKGLDLLLEAMNSDEIRSAGVKLIVAGEFYGDEAFYTGLISKYNLGESVKLFTSFIPNEEVRYYFCAADVVVQPYRSATQSGITQIAYHFEKPMIVTDVGGLAENVPDEQVGFVVPPDAASIADAILRFYTPGKGIPSVRENIRKEKQQYSWASFVQRLLGLLPEIS